MHLHVLEEQEQEQEEEEEEEETCSFIISLVNVDCTGTRLLYSQRQIQRGLTSLNKYANSTSKREV